MLSRTSPNPDALQGAPWPDAGRCLLDGFPGGEEFECVGGGLCGFGGVDGEGEAVRSASSSWSAGARGVEAVGTQGSMLQAINATRGQVGMSASSASCTTSYSAVTTSP